MHERIRDYLETNGMLFKFVAQKADIKPSRFYRLMNGRAPLTVDEYEVICRKGLSMDPGYFFNQYFLDFAKRADSNEANTAET